MIGGPVEVESHLLVLHGDAPVFDQESDNEVQIAPGMFLVTAREGLERLAARGGTPKLRCFAGYAGVGSWSARRGTRRGFVGHAPREQKSVVRRGPRRRLGQGAPQCRDRSGFARAGRITQLILSPRAAVALKPASPNRLSPNPHLPLPRHLCPGDRIGSRSRARSAGGPGSRRRFQACCEGPGRSCPQCGGFPCNQRPTPARESARGGRASPGF